MNGKNFTTKALHVRFPKADAHRALQMPIYESVAFEFDSAEQIAANFRGEYPAHVYSRTSNPTVECFEHKVKMLTGAAHVLAVTSGMAAITNTILALAKAGDNIIASEQLFGHTYALFKQTLPDLGIEVRFCNYAHMEQVEQNIDSKTRLVYFETVTNPQLNIVDIEQLAGISKKNKLTLVSDSTLTPPSVFNGNALGVDVEVMSTTKFISGGATSIGGLIINHGHYNWANNPNLVHLNEKFGSDAFIARLRKNIYRNTGACMNAHTAYYQILGLDILELRVERCYKNCVQLGNFLKSHAGVQQVNYPGLPDHPQYALALKQFNGIPGTIMSFDLESEAKCFSFMNKLQIIRRATNLNDNKSLIIHPFSTIYCEFPLEKRAEMEVRPTMLRLSVGIEGIDDLIADIEQALL